MNKQKILSYIEDLEDKAKQSDKYFIERNELYAENQQLKAELELYKGSLKKEHEQVHRANDLEDRIDKAIEYIENEGHGYDITGDGYYCLDEDNQNELLKILKGE